MRREKFVPLEKQSKKEQRRHHAAHREDWNGVSPVTRIIPNKKKQHRRDTKAMLRLELL